MTKRTILWMYVIFGICYVGMILALTHEIVNLSSFTGPQ